MHMIFDTKDEKLAKVEKRVCDMERRMEYNLQKMNDTIKTLNEIILRLQKENIQLRSERDFLVERHKKLVRRVPVPDLALEVSEKLVRPVAARIKENADFVQLIAREGFVAIKEKKKRQYQKNPVKELKEHIIDVSSHSYGKSIDNLFEIVGKEGKIKADEAARKLNVHEIQIEEWAKILEDHDLVTIKKSPLGKMEIIKI